MMKVTKLLSALAVLALISVGTTSCSSDDNVIRNEKNNDQKEVGSELPFEGNFAYAHAGNPIPFEFTKKTISMKMSGMAGSGLEDDNYNVIKVYKDKNNVLKAVAKNTKESEYKAFFFKNIKEESLDININYSFKSEIEAIESTYPTAGDITPDHGNNIFPWLKLTRTGGEEPVKINLPVQGKYVFSSQGYTYFYKFSNTVVNFNDSYDMKVLQHNTNTNKVLLEGVGEKAGTFYVLQLNNITENTVDVARLTYGEADAKTKAEAEFALASELTGGRFNTYTKEGTDGGETTPAFTELNGTYLSAIIKVNGADMGQYEFHIGENDEAFIFMGDFRGTGTFTPGGKIEMKRVFADESKGQIIYEILHSEGYYDGRTGEFLTLYVRDYKETANKATFAIATKNGEGSIAASKGNAIGKTLEEAKAIAAPDAMKMWNGGMMEYAHVWIPTTKK
ncbi:MULTISPECIES: hypothetical protein [unclassified Myroides]|uniref:hypothetical protein n=1 Tax=unclassified Myroides TaxID=2642485 RepID=UPI003D2F8873